MSDSGQDWRDFLPFLEPLANSLECGLLLIDRDDKIVIVSHPLASMFGVSVDEILAMTPARFVEYTAKLADDPPQRLKEGRMLPAVNETAVVCEEFELMRPCRSVLRWVARTVRQPSPVQLVVVTDITAEVDLTAAYERLAITDRLTGLANRRGIEQVVRREILRSKRYATPLSMVMFDIDHFKMINDTNGHGAGDQVLRQVARAIAGQLRESDLASRWGGEEFLVLLPNTALGPAHACAERIRKNIAKLTTATGTQVTISGGVAQIMPGEAMTDAIGRADSLLYVAKAQGRNRVC